MSNASSFRFLPPLADTAMSARSGGSTVAPKPKKPFGSELTERDITHEWSTKLTEDECIEGFNLVQKQAENQFEAKAKKDGLIFFATRPGHTALLQDMLGFDIRREMLCKSAVMDDTVPLGAMVFSFMLIPDMTKLTYTNMVVRWVQLMDNISKGVNEDRSAKQNAGILVEMLNDEVQAFNKNLFTLVRKIKFTCNADSITCTPGAPSFRIQKLRIKYVKGLTNMLFHAIDKVADKFFNDLENKTLMCQGIDTVEATDKELLQLHDSDSKDDEDSSAEEVASAVVDAPTTTPIYTPLYDNEPSWVLFCC